MNSKWHPIEDVGDHVALASGELAALGDLWTEQRSELAKRGLLVQFITRLQREWAIETGILERLYDLDRGVTRLLVERGISADLIGYNGSDRDPALVAQILRDHADVAEDLLDFVGGDRILSTSYVKQLHAALTRSQETTEAVDQFGRVFQVELLHGSYKNLPNNPTRPNGSVHEYCPPVHVAAEMDELMLMHERHSAYGVPAEVEASFLHHRFTQIHPFQDGNGRVARALASLVFLMNWRMTQEDSRRTPCHKTSSDVSIDRIHRRAPSPARRLCRLSSCAVTPRGASSVLFLSPPPGSTGRAARRGTRER
jgi:hypothetical protein